MIYLNNKVVSKPDVDLALYDYQWYLQIIILDQANSWPDSVLQMHLKHKTNN